MNWDDVSTQIRTLVDEVLPVDADEAVRYSEAPRPARPARRGPAWRKPTLAAAASILVAAAVWTATTSAGDDPGADVATGSTTDASGAPNPQTGADTGPLALAELPVSMQVSGSGTLEITEECTFLRTVDGDRDLLVWPAHRTTWVPESGTILVESLDGGPAAELADGDTISLSGGSQTVRGPGAVSLEWVAEPKPSCLAGDHAWLVGGPVTVNR